MSLTTCMLILTLLVFVLGCAKTVRILSTGSPETMLRNAEQKLESVKRDINHKGAFVAAWFLSLVITLFFTGTAFYVLSQMISIG